MIPTERKIRAESTLTLGVACEIAVIGRILGIDPGREIGRGGDLFPEGFQVRVFQGGNGIVVQNPLCEKVGVLG